MPEPANDDPKLIAAREVLAGRTFGREVNECVGSLLSDLGGYTDGSTREARLLELILHIESRLGCLDLAICALAGDEALARAQAERDIQSHEGAESHPDLSEEPSFLRRQVDTLARNAPLNWSFFGSSARVTITIDGVSHFWATQDSLLGAAIAEVFQQHLNAGETLFLGDATVSPQGTSYDTIEIPPTATLEWTYTDATPDVVSAVAAQVEDHVQRFGGVTLDAHGNLVEPPSDE